MASNVSEGKRGIWTAGVQRPSCADGGCPALRGRQRGCFFDGASSLRDVTRTGCDATQVSNSSSFAPEFE